MMIKNIYRPKYDMNSNRTNYVCFRTLQPKTLKNPPLQSQHNNSCKKEPHMNNIYFVTLWKISVLKLRDEVYHE